MSNCYTTLFHTRHNIGIPVKHSRYICDIPIIFSHHLCKEDRTSCVLILLGNTCCEAPLLSIKITDHYNGT